MESVAESPPRIWILANILVLAERHEVTMILPRSSTFHEIIHFIPGHWLDKARAIVWGIARG